MPIRISPASQSRCPRISPTISIRTCTWRLIIQKRPNYNPSDSFFTVTLMSPSGTNIPQIYTGNLGASTTQIIKFDSTSGDQVLAVYLDKRPWHGIETLKALMAATLTRQEPTHLWSRRTSIMMSSSYSGTAAFGTVTSGDKTVTFTADTSATSPTMLPSLTAPVETAATNTKTTMPDAAGNRAAEGNNRYPEKDHLFPAARGNRPHGSWHRGACSCGETEGLIIQLPLF